MRKILIDSLTDTILYIEKKIPMNIVCNKLINKNGLLEIDANKNALISMVDSGDTFLKRLTAYNGQDGVLFYNRKTKAMQLVKLGEELNITIDFDKGTQYFLGAKKIKCSNYDNIEGSFSCSELGNANIFKIFCDGREIQTYRVDSIQNKIFILGNEKFLLDEYSDIIIYTYTKNTIDDETTFTVSYTQYRNIFNINTFMDESYFQEEFTGEKIINFESISIEPQTIRESYKKPFGFGNRYRINSITNRTELNVFLIDEQIDLVSYTDRKEFRIILINTTFGRALILNNCYVTEGTTITYDKSKNTKKMNIEFGNYLDIYRDYTHSYGKGRYGRYKYGGGSIYLENSHRTQGGNVYD